MENKQIVPFAFGDNLVRVIEDGNGKAWFVAKDILKSLDYPDTTISNISKAIQNVPEEWKGRYPIPTPSGTQEMLTLSEEGLYFYLGRSDKPKALPFQKWLAGEVIPSIRKTGRYESPGAQRVASCILPADFPEEALQLRPAMRQKLWRDAIQTARLDGGTAECVKKWFAYLCAIAAAMPPAPIPARSKVRAFFNQCCRYAEGSKVRAEVLYEAFRSWHAGQDGDLPSKKAFGIFFQEYATRLRSNGSFYKGICLK